MSKKHSDLLEILFGVTSTKSTKTRNEHGGHHHHTMYRHGPNDHISWDTDKRGNFVPGSGHRDVNGKKKGKNW
ncbi:hypothetical protein IJI99_02780 [bacterium]|nr:hypothetical protein [bacterium]